MTLVVSVSANTAAYAAETLRHARRVSVKDQVADTKADADRNVRRAENVSDPAAPGLVPPAAVSIDVLSSGRQPQQQTTLRQAEAAYRELDF